MTMMKTVSGRASDPRRAHCRCVSGEVEAGLQNLRSSRLHGGKKTIPALQQAPVL